MTEVLFSEKIIKISFFFFLIICQHFILMLPFEHSVDRANMVFTRRLTLIRVLVDCLINICWLFIVMVSQQTFY